MDIFTTVMVGYLGISILYYFYAVYLTWFSPRRVRGAEGLMEPEYLYRWEILVRRLLVPFWAMAIVTSVVLTICNKKNWKRLEDWLMAKEE